MAHFAKINAENIVEQVVVVENTVLEDGDLVEQESLGIQFLQSLFGGEWVQTSYNKVFRKNFAGIGHVYDAERDAFIPPKPFDSWVLDESTCLWEAPVPMPDIELGVETAYWDEDNLQWVVE